MTVNVAGRRSRATKAATPPAEGAPLATGEIEQTVFSCPACSRPLAIGSRRCPGCGSRLVMGVQARRASVFIGLGLLLGLGFGVGSTSIALSIGREAREAEIAAAAAAAALAAMPAEHPVATASPAPTPSVGSGTGPGSGSSGAGGVPAIAKSAIGQAVALDERLATSASALSTAAAASTFDTVEVAAILRTLSGDAVFGLQLTSHIGSWEGGTQLDSDLTSFYTAIRQTAAEGLTASIRNEAAYRAAAERMLDVLIRLDALHLDVQAAAAEVGVSAP